MVGTHLHRNITWAEHAKPFITYLARSCFLLQQGHPVVDLAYLLDEGAPSTPPIWGDGTRPAPPAGYDHDFINADVLLNRLAVGNDGRLVLPDGMSYGVLVLPDSDAMRPELLRKLRELVDGGAVIVGPKPRRSPGLTGYPQCDDETRALAEAIWGDLDGISRTVRHVGKGLVVWGRSLEHVLVRRGISPDFEHSRGLDTELAWMHRRANDVDIYYVANLRDHPERVDARFRVAGTRPEIWRADDGSMTETSYRIDGNRTVVPLDLGPHDAVFVVFRGAVDQQEQRIPEPDIRIVNTIDGPWSATFDPSLGGPELLEMHELRSWTEHDAEGVRYYSGAADYTKSITVESAWLADGQRVQLDLGQVGDIAVVTLNDRELGTLWKPPYVIDVTEAARPGENKLMIRVINQWTNRLIGDAAAPENERVLASSVPIGGFGRKPDLAPSGLLGPVTLRLVGEATSQRKKTTD